MMLMKYAQAVLLPRCDRVTEKAELEFQLVIRPRKHHTASSHSLSLSLVQHPHIHQYIPHPNTLSHVRRLLS